MHSKGMRFWGMLAILLCITPLLAVAQPQPRAPRSDSGADRSRGAMQVVNDWRDEVSLSMWSDQRERIGAWSIRPGEQVVLQERGQRIRVRPNYKMKVGEDGGWVDVGQVGQFQNGTWYVNVRAVWQATHHDRRESPRETYREGYDSRRGDERRGETSPLDQILKKFKLD
jgi:hypothetical protein